MKKRKYAKKTIRKTKSTSRKAAKKPSRSRNTKGNARRSKSIRKVTRKRKINRATKKVNRNKRLAKKLFTKYQVPKSGEVRKSIRKGLNEYRNERKFIYQFDDGSVLWDSDSIEEIVSTGVDFLFDKFPNAKKEPRTAWMLGFLIRYQAFEDTFQEVPIGEPEQRFPNAISDDPNDLAENFYNDYAEAIANYKSLAVVLEVHVSKITFGKRKYKQVADHYANFQTARKRQKRQSKRSKVRGR